MPGRDSRVPYFSFAVDVGQGYHSLAENLLKFEKLPRTLRLDRMDEGQGIEAAMVTNEAKWHKMCRLRYNNQMLQRTEKREHQSPERDSAPCKCSRLQSSHKPHVFSVVMQLALTAYTR